MKVSGAELGIERKPSSKEGHAGIERKSSIESEPRTLTFEQLRYAREAALYVTKTKTLEEAVRIFTEGLQPVLSISRRHKGRVPVDLEDFTEEWDNHIAAAAHMKLPSPILKDVATAPF